MTPRPRSHLCSIGYAYRPALDGLRALAVIAVVAYHLDGDVLPGGFLGVDVFFVLSGYLIAGLLLVEHGERGSVALGAFWVRRARRLLPALAGVLVAVAAYARWWAPRDTLDRLRVDAAATLGYVANWRFALSDQSYFDTNSVLSPLRHAWSLAVEEQFYVLFPLLAMACFASRRPARTLGIVATLGAVASAGAMAATYDAADPSFVYYATHTRAQGLLVGVALACWSQPVDASSHRWRAHALQGFGAAGLGAVAIASFAISDADDFMYRGGYLAAAIAVAAVIAASVRPGGLRAALSIPPLRWIGQRSYGLYLWHWPAIVALEPARTGLEGWRLAFVRVVATVVPATISYRFLETPIRLGALGGRRFAMPSIATAGTVVVALLVATTGGTAPAVALTGAPLDAAPQVLVSATSLGTGPSSSVAPGSSQPDPSTTRPTSTSGAPPPTEPRDPNHPTDPTDSTDPTGPTDATQGTTPITVAPSTSTSPPRFAPTKIAVVGDSVAASALPGIQGEAQRRGVGLVSFVVPGCGIATGAVADDDGNLVPWSPDCAGVIEDGLDNLVGDHDPDLVIWWSGWENADRIVDGDVLRVGTDAWASDLDAMLEARWRQLSAGGARVVLVDSTPRAASPIAEADRDPLGRNAALRARLRALVQRHPATTALVEVSKVLCPGGVPCPREVDGTTPRPNDGGHFTDATAPWIAARLWPLAETAWRGFTP